MQKENITIVYNTCVYVYKFRMNLIKQLQNNGYHIIVMAPYDSYVEQLKKHNVEFFPIEMSQYGMNPFKEIKTIYSLWKGFNKYKPSVSLHYTIKPNIFGNIAAKIANVSVINNIAGAGKAFSHQSSIFLFFIENLFRYALSSSNKVFFQNNEDMNYFIERKIVDETKAERIPGSGVDLTRFNVQPFKDKTKDNVQFLFVGRLLKQKGIEEFLKAAIEVTKHYKNVEFVIVGEHESYNDYIDKTLLNRYCNNSSNIKYLGSVNPDKMPTILQQCDCVVLPSYYREGVPRSLLEAAAIGKPIITTDNVGCREVVEDGITGFKCEVKNIQCLIETMKKIIEMGAKKRYKMGCAGRAKIEKEFDEKFVLNSYMKTIESITQKNGVIKS